ncbi:SRPBCC family protein [Tenggerimyces flavus]|uniref:SRPBCC family protein n=1 Tax=Tenggerimyces flavus TaxID=1708749 RepID=A0ABV7YJP8_9ACTN|nr:SRPBCC family protein [Tenggerimyces flavus]MBM7787385.1 uncharacterized protein YndB with AHSA1/START domain [Tenggerimyces flavus]
MARATHLTEIDRAPAEVFAVAADPENQPRWDEAAMVGVEKLSAGPLARGSRYRGTWRRFGVIDYIVAEYDPPRRFQHDAATSVGRVVHTFMFEPAGDHTRLTQEITVVEPNLVGLLMSPFTPAIMRRRLSELGDELKAYVENAQPA